MRRAWRILGLSVLVEGVLYANGITGCTLDSLNLTGQCYNANTFFTTPLALDWGTAFGPALIQPGNPHDLSVAPLTTTIAGITVNVSSNFATSGATSQFLTRVDNEVFVWNGSAWVVASAFGNAVTYDGHFEAPGPAEVTGTGAPLLEMFTNTNPNVYGTGSYVITFSTPVHSVGLLVSVHDSLSNVDFSANITSFDQNANPLSTYAINTTGVGGVCPALDDVPPVPCNDAPFIGIQAPNYLSSQQISSVVISAHNGGLADSVLLGSLVIQEVPEPSVLFLCGAGLFVLIGVLRRRQGVTSSGR